MQRIPASQNVKKCIFHGKQYFHVKDRLFIANEVLMYSYDEGEFRFVIPKVLRKSILKNLHSAHQGCEGMIRRAQHCVYWLGMNNELKMISNTCNHCIEKSPSLTKEELITTPAPEYPFQEVVADLFETDGHN